MALKSGREGVRKDQVDSYGRVKANEQLTANGKNFIFAYDEETDTYGYKLTEDGDIHPFDGSNSIYKILNDLKLWFISDNIDDTIAVKGSSSSTPINITRTSNDSVNIVRAYIQNSELYRKISFIALSTDSNKLSTITWVGDGEIVKTFSINGKKYYYKVLPYGDEVTYNDIEIVSDGDQYNNEILYTTDGVTITTRYAIANAIVLLSK